MMKYDEIFCDNIFLNHLNMGNRTGSNRDYSKTENSRIPEIVIFGPGFPEIEKKKYKFWSRNLDLAVKNDEQLNA